MIPLWIALGVLGALILADLAVAWYFIFRYLWRKPDKDPVKQLRRYGEKYAPALEMMVAGLDWLDTQELEDIYITSHDSLPLHARILPADKPTDKVALCVHGYHSSARMDFGASIRFMHECGCNVLIPDDRAHGQSGGHFIGFSYLDRRDCISWCRYIEGRWGADCRILLVGISMGAATVLAASGDDSLPACVRGVLGDCGFCSGWDEFAYQMKKRYRLPTFPILHTADLMLRIFAGYSLRRDTAADMIKNTHIPLLIIHGRADDFVPTYMAEQLYGAAHCDKRLLLVEGAVHGVSYCVAPELYRDAVRDLMERAGMPADQ